jgi:16S rRNA (guanine966-N2)-methyltransferase
MTLKIQAGTHRGRVLATPAGQGALRPTSARRREAVFDILTARLGDLAEITLADLFAGTGAVGLEALSRGAARVVFVENDPAAARLIRRNLETLGLTGRARVLQNDASRLSVASEPVDAVFLDPPYGRGLAERALARLRGGGWLAADAVVLVELGRDDPFAAPAGFHLAREHPHGAGRLLRLEAEA